jgi:hypothetical protein
MSETAVRLPQDWNGTLLCRQCATPLYFIGRYVCFHPKNADSRLGNEPCPLESRHWKVEPVSVDAIEIDEAPPEPAAS